MYINLYLCNMAISKDNAYHIDLYCVFICTHVFVFVCVFKSTTSGGCACFCVCFPIAASYPGIPLRSHIHVNTKACTISCFYFMSFKWRQYCQHIVVTDFREAPSKQPHLWFLDVLMRIYVSERSTLFKFFKCLTFIFFRKYEKWFPLC